MRRPVLPAVLLAFVALAACGSDGAAGRPPADTTASQSTSAAGATQAQSGDAGTAQAIPRGVRLARVASFSSPVYVTAAPGDNSRLYVVEQAGRVMVVRNGRKLARPFLDIRSQVLSGGEQGLLSIAFAPDFAQSRRFYVYFTGRDGRENVVEGVAAGGDRASASGRRLVLRMDDPEPNHNGGLLLFGPDRHLYIGTGDGGGGDDQHGSRGNAQDLGSLLGKILRIDPAASGADPYTVPRDNPFVGRAGARPEIYSYGLRNPWRFSFDRRTRALTIADVGQNAVEEVDIVAAGKGSGANFGWRPFEGRRRNFDEPAPGAIAPAITHDHSAGYCSIIGGYVVRDPGLPGLAGRYVYSDICADRLRSARLRPGRSATSSTVGSLRVRGISSFGEDNRGRVYAVSLSGPVYRLVASR